MAVYEGDVWVGFGGLTTWQLHALAILFFAAAVFFLAGVLLRREQSTQDKLRGALALSEVLNVSLPGAVAVIDVSATVRRWNQNFLGYPASEMLGAGIMRLVAPESLNDVQRTMKAAFENGTSEGEAWLVAKGGAKVYCYLKGVRFIFENAPCVLAVAIDVSKMKRAEEQIRLQSAALECAANGIVITDTHGTIQWVNPGFTRLTGYSFEEALGQNPRILKSGEQDESFYRNLWQTILAGNVWSGEIKNLNKDVQPYIEEMTISPVRSVTGEITNFVAIKQNITERKRIEAELLRAKDLAEVANRAKSEFVANMSHEIRTPMNGIIGMTELALDTHLTGEQHEYLSTVKQSAEALLNVINDVLDFSKIEAGRMDLEATVFSLDELLGETIKFLALRAREKNLEFSYDLADDIPPLLSGDPLRLRQVLINLVSNAIKFTERGKIAVTAELQNATGQNVVVHFQVRDTGVGIAADKLAHIFQPFSQADSSTTRKHGGTGLGLTISARIVGMMHGRIWVDSVPGKGSTFHFTAEFAASDALRPGVETSSVLLNGMSALVVDDDATNRKILDRFLRKWGMQPTAAESGLDALREIELACKRGHPFPLVLIDGHMPGMDGFGLAERIRSIPGFTGHTVMMLTSGERRGDLSRCEELGISACLFKPIRGSELLKAILQALPGNPQATPRLPEKAAHHETHASKHALRILLAEDNEVNRRLTVCLLEKAGYTVAVAENGSQALAMVKSHQFDLILMDVQMPEMDGFEATLAIRALEHHTHSHIPIIAMTAHAMKGDRERCLQIGMDGYIAKPINRNDLLAIIAEHAPSTHVVS
ncbi:MAG TPA: response regulator [Candidatus Acidoferrum sp.]|nr:response regulator [Candidatus Acidoferrum sp.]